MKFYVDREQKRQYLFQGIFLGLFPGTLITAMAADSRLPGMWGTAAGIAVPLLFWGGAALLFRAPLAARILAGAGAVLHLFLLRFELLKSPLLTLFCALCCAGLFFLLFTVRLLPAAEPGPELRLNRLTGASASLLCVTMLSPLVFRDFAFISMSLPLPVMTVFYLFYDYWVNCVNPERKGGPRLLFLAAAASVPLALADSILLPAFCAAAGCFLFASLRKDSFLSASGSFIRHPGRCLALTFLLLCAAGTLLLCTPAAAAAVLLTVIVMLLTTQSIGARGLIFESVSALATVGLSLGVTPELDEVGKIIIMTAMFVGRIGPLTLFLLLSDKKSTPQPGLPPVKIPLG